MTATPSIYTRKNKNNMLQPPHRQTRRSSSSSLTSSWMIPLAVLGVMILNHCHPIDAANDDSSSNVGVGSSILDGRYYFTSDVTQYLNLAYDAAELDETEDTSEKMEIYKIVSTQKELVFLYYMCSLVSTSHPSFVVGIVVVVVFLCLFTTNEAHNFISTWIFLLVFEWYVGS